MSGSFLYTVFIEHLTYEVRAAYSRIEQFVLSRRLIVCHASLDKLSHIECLMAKVPVVLPFLTAHPFMERIAYGPVCEKIAVGFLCRTDDINHSVDIFLELLVTFHIKQIGRPLYHLIYFGIVISSARLIRNISLSHLSGKNLPRKTEVLYLSGIGALLKSITYGALSEHVQTLAPEPVVHMHLGKRDRFYVFRSTNASTCGHKTHNNKQPTHSNHTVLFIFQTDVIIKTIYTYSIINILYHSHYHFPAVFLYINSALRRGHSLS